jgi:hypothetical protein
MRVLLIWGVLPVCIPGKSGLLLRVLQNQASSCSRHKFARKFGMGTPNNPAEAKMSIFGSIMNAIFGSKASAAPTAPSAGAASAGSPSTTTASPATATTAAPISRADVEALIAKIEESRGVKYNWRQSIVDLMKLLDLDSGLGARKELAQELGYTGALDGSADMNVWLHKQVMEKLAASGGTVPDSLKH